MTNQFYVYWNIEDAQLRNYKKAEAVKRFERGGINKIGTLNADDGKQYDAFLYEGLLIGIGEERVGTIMNDSNKSVKRRFKKIKNLTGVFFS